MKKAYQCKGCEHVSEIYLSVCPVCDSMNSFAPKQVNDTHETRTVALDEIRAEEGEKVPTGIGEFDKVLGGGVAASAVIVIGGDPGMGKSTLLLQAASGLSRIGKVLYVTGEESPEQIKRRAERLNVRSKGIVVSTAVSLDAILAAADDQGAHVLIIDSIQTIYTEEVSGMPGSLSQVKACCINIVWHAKKTNRRVFIVSQVTKKRDIAGPRALEHYVDAVLYFEGERDSRQRVLKAFKNRFAATDIKGLFVMEEKGVRGLHADR
jgi:DNA repair protein RadA/Sms